MKKLNIIKILLKEEHQVCIFKKIFKLKLSYFSFKFVPLLFHCLIFLDKDQIKDQLDSDHFSPSRQTETFIISETEEDPSKAGMYFELYLHTLKLFGIINYRINLLIIINIIYFTEARVLQVERKMVLKPDQAEFVLSEGMLIRFYCLKNIKFDYS